MKITVKAGDFAEALALTELALTGLTPEIAKKIAALSAVRIAAADGVTTLTSNILDFSVTVKAQAEIIEPGEAAVSLRSLSALISGFPKNTAVTISATDKMAAITGGQGRFRLALIALDDMPAVLDELVDRANVVELNAIDLLRLLTATTTASTESTRYYLNGILLRSTDSDLVAVGTDGRQLMRVTVAADTFSTDRGAIVPLKAATTIQKILRKTKPDKVELRRTKTLFMVQAPGITFVTKLVDAEYPHYERIIPEASANTVTCESGDLVAALRRLTAIATKFDNSTIAALRWREGQGLNVLLARQPEDGFDVVAAETAGSAQIALPLSQLTTLLQEIDADTITLSADGTSPLLIKRAGDDRFLALQTLCAFNFAAHETA